MNNLSFELTGETRERFGITLRQWEAVGSDE